MDNLKSKKLIIFGNTEVAEVAYVYFMHDTDYEVCGFTVEEKFLSVDKCSLFNLPIVPFEDLEKYFPHSKYEIFIAIAYKKMNRIREKFATISEFKGYRLASYISTNALISPNVQLGKNIFILESNVIQPFS
jgi:UDP-3-O-[3-hydroxymyristoyl] glucosamine N-acyltransferase